MSKIDYNLSKIQGVVFDVDGVLSPSTIPVGADGEPQRMANVKDGYAIQLAIKSGIKVAIISGARPEIIRSRFKLLGVKDIYLGVSEKLPVLLEWMEQEGLSREEVAYVGDDIPDIPPMQNVGLPVAPRDAAMETKAIAKFITGSSGGCGVGRELLEEILKVHGYWMNDIHAFGW